MYTPHACVLHLNALTFDSCTGDDLRDFFLLRPFLRCFFRSLLDLHLPSADFCFAPSFLWRRRLRRRLLLSVSLSLETLHPCHWQHRAVSPDDCAR